MKLGTYWIRYVKVRWVRINKADICVYIRVKMTNEQKNKESIVLPILSLNGIVDNCWPIEKIFRSFYMFSGDAVMTQIEHMFDWSIRKHKNMNNYFYILSCQYIMQCLADYFLVVGYDHDEEWGRRSCGKIIQRFPDKRLAWLSYNLRITYFYQLHVG